MKHTQLEKPSTIGASTRGQTKAIKIHKRLRNRFIRRTPIDDEHRPLTNRYAGWLH